MAKPLGAKIMKREGGPIGDAWLPQHAARFAPLDHCIIRGPRQERGATREASPFCSAVFCFFMILPLVILP